MGEDHGSRDRSKRDSHPTSKKVTTQLKDIVKKLPLRVLRAGGLGALDDQGLCDCSQCGAADHVQRLVDLLWRV